MDKLAGELLWTNLRVIWEHPYSDQWEAEQDNQINRVDQSEGSKSAWRERREREIDIMKALYFVERLWKSILLMHPSFI